MNKVLYRETQSLWWLVAIFGAFSVQIVLAGIFQWGTKPVPLDVAIVIGLLLLLPALAFYNLTITITQEYAVAKFGIGFFKRKVPLKTLDTSRAAIVHLSLFAGVGYRISSKGVFLNTRPGPALFIPSNTGGKNFFVGTKNGTQILEVIKDCAE